MNARNQQPVSGDGTPPIGDAERLESDEVERLRLRLAEVSSRLADSERRRLEAEANLLTSDGRFEACLDAMMDGVLINRAIRDEAGRIVDFRIVYSNEAASRISGVPHEELIDHRILDLFPGRRENGQFEAYVRVVETGEPLVRNSVKDHDVSDRSDPAGFGRDFEVSVSRLGDGYVATLHDIVARRRAEQELFRSQQMLRLVLDTIPQRVFWKDTNSVLVGCNAAFARDAGMADPADLVGKTDYDLSWREFADDYVADDKAVMSGGKAKLGYDESQTRPDGSHSWLHVSKVPLLDGDGRVVGLLGTYEDVTDRKVAEEALRESERFLTSILDNIPSMVFVKDAKTLTFVRVNRATERTLGYTSEQLVSPDSRQLGPADESDYFATMDQRVVDTGQPLEFPEEVLTTPHLGTRYMRTKKVPLFDEQGKPQFVLGISEDITELKLAEDARRDSEERYLRIIETITDYVISVRIERGRAVSVSHGPGCVAVTGYAAEELSGDPDMWFRLVVAEDREEAWDQHRRCLAGDRTGPLEYRIHRKDGAVRWVRNTPVLRLDPDGTPIAYDGVIQDITERRGLQEQLLQSQKMEGIGRLAGGVAHDFNNLLTAILGFVEMCKLDLPSDLPPDHPARLDLVEIGTAGERAAGLTRQLLTFARKQIVAPVRLDLSDLVADSLKMLQRLIGDDVEIETALEPGAGTVEADPSQIQQLLVNLTLNARDAMPEGGRLLIETAGETIDEESRPGAPGRHSRVVPAARGGRYRHRHGRGSALPPVRALLHDQGTWQGHGPRSGHLSRNREVDGRAHSRVFGARPGHDLPHLPAAESRCRGSWADAGSGDAQTNRRRDGAGSRGRAPRAPSGGARSAGPRLRRARGGGRSRGNPHRRASRTDHRCCRQRRDDARHERARAAGAALGHRPAGAGRVDVRPRGAGDPARTDCPAHRFSAEAVHARAAGPQAPRGPGRGRGWNRPAVICPTAPTVRGWPHSNRPA